MTIKYLGFFNLRTGILFNGFALMFDILAQFIFMYKAGKFDWFEHNFPLFDLTKTGINIFFFLLMFFKDTKMNQKLYFIATLLNTISTGIYSLCLEITVGRK